MFEKNYGELYEQMTRADGEIEHRLKKSLMLPFATDHKQRVEFENGFNGTIGELSRIYNGKVFFHDYDLDNLIDEIIVKSKIESIDEDEKVLKDIIKEYLIKDASINVIHPYLFQYLPLNENKHEKTGEKKIAKFLRDIFLINNTFFKDFFNIEQVDNILINFILDNIDKLDDEYVDPTYCSSLNFISKLFNNDLEFLMKDTDYLKRNLDIFFAYYYFFYVSQLSLKMSKGSSGIIDEPDEIYYLLDWENVSKNRKSVELGYKFLKDENLELLTYVNQIEQLNLLFGTRGLLIPELMEKYDDFSDESKNQCLFYLNKWISTYINLKKITDDVETTTFECNIEDLINKLFEILKKGINSAPKYRYALNVENIAKKYFLKRRGKYGHMLNINQEILLLITKLSIKGEKMKITHLFKEFEKRGLYFDKYSKEEIISLFNKLNIIDKKSDSGDAQYVKPIL
ncbi:hypothetical protein MBCUT_17330 [Methanobrevibacter cuticularis]|uniref:DNA phosphorothioation-dependent restriction protein DptG n=1 Tax=Methanobrevibacter cuticularis TaxID=47311 RepID=A0A166D0Y2_9EURY|nr:DNA phosphorothioation-dependent restriction protein DptG [Methanobrevibacter cuticularis]KZX15088.1 hypothetical protein MBCUT_17330 [Methanobrevibacter cuticularis]